MADEGFKRKLAAILSADVEGYSRLMGQNEEATIRTLTTYRNAIAKLVQQYRGRVVDTPGDNILSEFSSVVDAINCAVEIQRELAERNAGLPYERKMEFRIGVNVGDVVEEEDRIYRKAFDLNPIPPSWYYEYSGETYLSMGRFEEAIDLFKKAIDIEPNSIFSHLGLVVAYTKVGQIEVARFEVSEVYRIDPGFSLDDIIYDLSIDPEGSKISYFDVLRKAGLK